MISCSADQTVSETENTEDVDSITAEAVADSGAAEEDIADDTAEAISEEDIITVGGSSAMYIATDVKDIYIYSDLAVRARYVKDIDTYALEDSGMPVTIAGFEVLEVLKGEYSDDSIEVK